MSKTFKDKPSRILYGDDVTKKPKVKDTTWHWLQATPSWWNNMFHTRPRRRESQRFGRIVEKTSLDTLEELDKPNVSNKPHKYYW